MAGAQIQTTLGPNGIIVNNSHHTKTVYKLNYVWKIDDYSSHYEKKSCLQTPVFAADTNPNFRWYFTHKPGTTVENEDNMSIFLNLHPSSERKKAFVQFRFSILNDELKEKVIFTNKIVDELRAGDDGMACCIISKHRLSNKKILPDGRLTVYCEVTFSEAEDFMDASNESNLNSVQVLPDRPAHCISQDLRDLFTNQELADVTLSVNGKEYRAHKTILAARSPVFAAMFKHNTKENMHNRVEIIDIDEKVFEAMLLYMYTDECRNLKNLAVGLLAASNKYNIEGLKIMSQKFLIKNLTVENAPEMLGIAELHCASELQSKTINFIVMNSISVTNSTNWKKFAPSYSQSLMIEVCSALSGQVAALKSTG